MEKNSKAMKNLKYLLLVSVLGLFASCSEDEPEYTPMSVSKISTVLDREEGIEQADLTQYIIVQGKGLSAVSSILVNDIPVDMDEVYVEDTEVTFSIPRVIPGEVNNLVTLSSGKETVTAPLVVYIRCILVLVLLKSPAQDMPVLPAALPASGELPLLQEGPHLLRLQGDEPVGVVSQQAVDLWGKAVAQLATNESAVHQQITSL